MYKSDFDNMVDMLHKSHMFFTYSRNEGYIIVWQSGHNIKFIFDNNGNILS